MSRVSWSIIDGGRAGEPDFAEPASALMIDALQRLSRVAPLNVPVMLQGDTGTGKEILARILHARSGRRGRFEAVNVGAVEPNLFAADFFGYERGAFTDAVSRHIGRLERAHGGTLFLDEISDLPLQLQPRLLRAIQEHEFERVGGESVIRSDFRLVAATNCDLEDLVARGRFREDLYHRIRVVEIRIPRLCDRPEDIPTLVRFLVMLHSRSMGRHAPRISDDAYAPLLQHRWPGNVRELENVVQQTLAMGPDETIRSSDWLGLEQRARPPTTEPKPGRERDHVAAALREAGGSKSRAARILGMKLQTFQYWCRKHGLD